MKIKSDIKYQNIFKNLLKRIFLDHIFFSDSSNDFSLFAFLQISDS